MNFIDLDDLEDLLYEDPVSCILIPNTVSCTSIPLSISILVSQMNLVPLTQPVMGPPDGTLLTCTISIRCTGIRCTVLVLVLRPVIEIKIFRVIGKKLRFPKIGKKLRKLKLQLNLFILFL